MLLTHPTYRPDIDGLRAIAILTVVGFHAFPGKVPGGFIGVDIFFVISGYLISTIIFSSIENNSFSLRTFYIRRVRRIFPALILVLSACLVFGWYVLLRDEFQQLGKHTAAGAAFIQNFILNNESGYFDNAADTKPLLHLWSLAIEEQFYLYWPLMLVFVWRRHWSFVKITLIIASSTFIVNLYLVDKDLSQAFYLPFSRFWELMVGGVLAHINIHRSHLMVHYRNTQAALGLSLIGAAVALIDKSTSFPGWWACLPTLGSFFVIGAGPYAWLNKKILSNKYMVAVGLISYPLYLWHWPLLTFVRAVAAEGAMPTREMKLVAVTVAFVLSWITYHFVEKRIKSNTKLLLISVLTSIMALLLILGLAINYALIKPRINNIDVEKLIDAVSDQEFPDGLERLVIDGQEVYQTKNFKLPYTLFVGDSHVAQYAPRVIYLNRLKPEKYSSVRFLVGQGCFPVPDVSGSDDSNIKCRVFRRNILKAIASGDVSTIIVGGCWNCYLTLQKTTVTYEQLPNDQSIVRDKSRISSFLNSIQDHKIVYFLLDNPIGEVYNPKNYFDGNRLTDFFTKTYPKSVSADQSQVKLADELSLIAIAAQARVIDPLPNFCKGKNECIASGNDGRPFYRDNNHLRPFYVRDYANYLDVALWRD